VKHKILVVDDDRKTVDLVRLYLEKDGYHVLLAYDGQTALELARHKRPDLLVLDVMLPKLDGLDLCRVLRAETHLPIILLTARTTEEDKLIGLDLGADDYITKPFSPRELLARIRAVLRRAGLDSGTPEPAEARYGALVINFPGREVRLAGQIVRLTPKEYRLLEILIKEPQRAFTRLELLERAFGYDYEGLERTIDVHLMNLRRKIEADPARPIFVQTVYGVGYKFGAAEPADAAPDRGR
jgi:DNA-binding response OmpR family regulator